MQRLTLPLWEALAFGLPLLTTRYTMFTLIIPDMTCNHCIKTISTAVARIDANAKLAFDLAEHQVEVKTSAPASEIVQAIKNAGYSVDGASATEEAPANCCGSCHV